MPNDDKAKWLAGLKVGDPVVVQRSSLMDKHGHLTAVAKLTPTQIVTEDGLRWRRKSGDAVGGSDYHSPWIKEPTAEREAAIKMDRILRQVEAIRWQDQSLATLEAVAELVSKAGKAGR